MISNNNMSPSEEGFLFSPSCIPSSYMSETTVADQETTSRISSTQLSIQSASTNTASLQINNKHGKQNKNQKIENTQKNTHSPLHRKTNNPFHSPIQFSPIRHNTTPLRNDTRRWTNLGGNILQRLRDPSQSHNWHPNSTIPQLTPVDPFGLLLTQQHDLTTISHYCQGQSDTILRLYRAPDIHITTKDLRDIISHNTPIYHESIVLCLELICSQFHGSYVDPSFIPMLKTQGWTAVRNRFQNHSSRNPTNQIDRPFFNNPIIAIPVHVNGFHWAALCRRIINNTVYFFYADDLNCSQTETFLKQLVMRNTSPDFSPSTSIWVNCITPKFSPHSMECGPRTMLALAIMITHPAPHRHMLSQYISENLAQNSRHWMSITLLTGVLLLLPPKPADNTQIQQVSRTIESHPHTLISWLRTSPNQSPLQNKSPKQMEHYQQSRNNQDLIQQHHSPSTNNPSKVLLSAKTYSTLPKIMGTQKLLPQLKEEKLEHPKKAPLMRVKGKHLQPPSQLTLFDTKQFESKIEMEAPNFWGHQPEPIDSTSIFRLFFNNPNGLKLTSDPTSVQYSFSLLSNLGVGAVGLAETNLNWEHPSNKAKLRNSIKKEWHHSTFITSHLKEDITGEIQPGGTLTFITNNWTSRVIDRGTDPYGLGRWTYITLRGQQGTKVTIVTAYRVCPQTLASIGPNTSTAQQYRTLSKEFRESDLVSDPKPRLQFIVDLQAWLEYKIQDQHSIILVLDANEGIQGTKGSYYPLEFTLGKPISTKGHDGSLATLIHTCGLCDPLCIQHTEYPPPPTYSRGKDRIDYILVSTGLLPSVLCTGIFPYDHIFITDHRPCYIDFDSKILFHDGTPSIATHIYRGLQTIDPRLTKAYEDLVNKQIQYHNIESRIQKLQEVESIHWNESHTKEYESIDQLLTEAMCSAEKSIAKKVTTTYAWSPVLKQAVSNLRYWQLSLKKAKGRAIPDSTLIRYQNEAELDPKNIPNPLKITDIVTRLRQARKDLHDYQKKHLELRTTHLLNLAEARLIARKPSILDPNNIHKLEKQRQVELKRIIRKESIRETHRKIGYLLNPNKFTSGLGSIDIPAGSNQPYPTGPDPKLWQGAWQTVTNPQDLADHIAAANAHQYHQADTTPFGQEPLKTFFGYKGDQPGAESLIQGHLPPPEIMTQLLPETQALLKYLSRTAQNSLTTSSQNAPTAGNTSPLITPEQFKALYKIIDERTSSSPSGRHVGHYKVAAHSALLSTIHSSMMSIPYKIGFSPRRWQQIIDVMLEKKPGDRRIHRLRIVALQESDFNQSNRLLLGRPLLHKLEDQHDIPDMQNGSRPSKMCHSAVLNKVLTYEIHRYQKKSLAYIENDAVGCYDRIVNPLIIIFLRILGLSPTLLSSLAATWESTYHRVKTLYGVSKVCYANDPLRLLYGPGQGSTIGPLLWLLCFILIFRSLSPSAPGITITSVDHQLSCQFKGEAFVDDAGLGVNLHSTDSSGEIELTVDEEHVLLTQQLQRLAQEWEKLLYSTGGALNLQKCFWFLLSWRWVGGKAKLHTQLTLPASLTMTAGLDNTPTTIPRIEPTQSFRTLGVYLTPSGCNKGAQTVLQDIVLQYATHITGSRINRQHALVSYIQYLLPKLRYQPPLLSLPQCALDKLQSTTLKAVLPKLNLNRNTARSIIHGPEEYGGLSLPHITHLQGIERLYLFLGHLRLQDRTAQLLQSDMSFLQLLTGSGSLCMNQPIRDYQWIETGWLTSLWDYVNTVQIQFIYPNHWLPNLPRQGDAFIMEQFIKMKLPNSIMERLNRCRLYLQALTISDLVSADGIRFLPSVKKGIPLEERRSSLLWPHQGPPTKADWQIWSNALSHLETNGQLTQPLGAWQATSHQQWSYFIHLPTQMVYHQPQGFAPRQYQPIINPNARTRSQLRPWYDFHHSVPAAALPHPLHPVTIDHNHVLTGSMFQINASTTPLVALPSSPKTNFLNLGKYLEGQPPPILQIQEAMADRNLTVVCSSNYDRDANLTTSTCSFQSQTILYEYESLPMTIPRYRAELFSVLISLYIIHQAEPSLPVTENTGSINLLSNSKKLVRQAFDRSPLGIRTAIRPHYDLILEIRHYRSSIQTPIVATYCPVHNGGVQPLQPLASDFVYICKESPYQYTIQTPLQSHVITAVYRGEPLLGNIQQTIVNENYKLPLQLKLQKDNGWTSEQFSLIDWLAYQRAFQKQPRSHRISIAKLSHQLWNTNSQNHKYYGQNDLCPYCKQSSETMTHIFTCTHPEATTNRASALDTLRQSLAPITPSNLLDTLISGLTQWTADPTLPTPLAPTEGSILPQLASLTTAFRQQSSLSWLALIRGHLAKGWATAYCANYVPRKNKPVQQETITQLSRQWCHKLIPMMWQYGKTIWSHRNAVVHGKTTLSPSKDLLQMQEKIRLHYHNFHCNNHYVPHAQAYLFQRDIQRTLQLRRDTMACWLHSVQEAILTQAHRQEKGNKKITSYFLPRPPPRGASRSNETSAASMATALFNTVLRKARAEQGPLTDPYQSIQTPGLPQMHRRTREVPSNL